jgi:hypothetical protein
VAVEVRATPLANKIIEELPRRSRRAYDQFEVDLAARGCAALAYRLSGGLLDHLCVAHLIGTMRVIVVFESAEVAYVVLVGNHDDSRPPLDVYRQLVPLQCQHAVRLADGGEAAAEPALQDEQPADRVPRARPRYEPADKGVSKPERRVDEQMTVDVGPEVAGNQRSQHDAGDGQRGRSGSASDREQPQAPETH